MTNLQKVNGQNVLDIIKYLYKKRLQQTPEASVLESWSNLDDDAAKLHLHQLFQNWKYSEDQMEQELAGFFAEQTNSDPITNFSSPENKTPQQTIATSTLSYEQDQAKQNQTSSNSTQTIGGQKSSKSTLWLLLLVPILALAGYVLYQFHNFKNLKYLYVTTDNVSIRDVDGTNIGRMDIFASKNSVSFLRTTDKKTYPILIGNKQYECRQVVFDSTSFADFLFKKPSAFGYVNENYVIDDKENFILYRNVFKSVNTIASENNSLISAYRKVIIGSIKQNASLESLYIRIPCTDKDKTTSSIVKLAKDNLYQVVAMLSDGKYYIFAGDPKSESYEAPRELTYKRPSDEAMISFANENLLFKQVQQAFYLFDCKGTALDYFLTLDDKGRIAFAQFVNYL